VDAGGDCWPDPSRRSPASDEIVGAGPDRSGAMPRHALGMAWQEGKQMKRKLRNRWRLVTGSVLVALVGAWLLTVTPPAAAGFSRTDVAVAHHADGRLEMFFLDQDHRVWHRTQNSQQRHLWSTWQMMAGTDAFPVYRIAAETNGNGTIELFGVNNTGRIFRWRQTSSNSQAWTPREDLTQRISAFPDGLSVTRDTGGGMVLFVATGGDIWGTRQLTSTTWSPLTRIADNHTFETVAAETNPSGAVELFATANGTLYNATEGAPGNGNFPSWLSMGTTDLHSVGVTKGPWGGMVVFGTDSPGNIWGITQLQGTRWSPWGQIPGTLTTVAAEINADRRLTLVGSHHGELWRAHTNLETGVNTGTYGGWLKSDVPPPPPPPPPPPAQETVPLDLVRQEIVEGPIPYLGRFPAFGTTRPGHLVQIRVPQSGPTDIAVLFVKAGRSTQECNNPSAVVQINEGQATTPAQITAIFGVAQPRFSTLQPLNFVACLAAPPGVLLNVVQVSITVQYD
jgi:hypothetical protein